MQKKAKVNRILTAFCVLIAAVLLLAACGGGDATTAAPKDTTAKQQESKAPEKTTAAAEKPSSGVKLTLVNWEGDQMNAAVREALAAYSKEAGFEVELQAAPLGDYKTSLNSMIMAGEAPSIYQSGHDWALSFFAEGLTYDWTAYAEADKDFISGFFQNSADLWKTKEGKQVGFPNFVNVYGIWYNVDLLKEAGLEAPKPGWTYEDLFQMAEKLADPAKEKYGLYGLQIDAFGVAQMAIGNGGEGFVDDFAYPTKVQADAEFTKAVERIRGLIANKVIPSTTYETANIQSQFTDGNVALLAYGQWLISDLINSDIKFEYGLAPNPVGENGKQVSIFDPVGWCSPHNLEHPDEAWELMKFVCSDLYNTVLPVTPVAACAYEPNAEAFFKTVTDAGHPETADAIKTMMGADVYVPVRFLQPWANDANKFWSPAYSAILDGEAEIDKLPEAIAELNDFISGQN